MAGEDETTIKLLLDIRDGLKGLNDFVQHNKDAMNRVHNDAKHGAEGYDLLSANIEKGLHHLEKLGTGFLAGLALEPLIGIVTKLSEGVKEGAKLFAEYTIEQDVVGESAAKLGAKAQTLSHLQEELTGHLRAYNEAQAQQLIQDGKAVGTTEDVANAIEQHDLALSKIEKSYKANIAASNSLSEREDAERIKRDQLRIATEAYNKALGDLAKTEREADLAGGKEYADHLNAQLQIEQKLHTALVGDTDALNKKTAALEKVTQATFREGTLNRETFTSISKAIGETLQQYRDLGEDAPAALSKLAERLGILREAEEKVRESIFGSSAAIKTQTEDTLGAISAAESFGEVNVHSATEVKALLSDLLDTYAKFGREVPADLQAVADAYGAMTSGQKAFSDAILGDSDALAQQTKDIEKVVASVEKEGSVTGPVRDNIKKQLGELLTKYNEFGEKVPASLQQIADKYDALSDKQAKLQEVLDKFATGPLAGPQQIGPSTDDLRQQQQAAQATVHALEQQQEQGNLTTDQMVELTNATDTLSDANFALGEGFQKTTNIFGEVPGAAKAINDAFDAAFGGARQDVADTVDGMGKLRDTSQSTADDVQTAFADAGKKIKEALGDGFDGSTKALKQFNDLVGDLNTQYLPETKDLVSEIADLLGGLGE